jgi:hypothetical protein
MTPLGEMAVDLAAQARKRERGDNRQPLGNRDIAVPLIVSDLNQTPLNGIPAKEDERQQLQPDAVDREKLDQAYALKEDPTQVAAPLCEVTATISENICYDKAYWNY